MHIQEIIGWTGALLFVVAYFLLSIKKLRPEGLLYQLLNIVGGVCLVVNSFHTHDYPRGIAYRMRSQLNENQDSKIQDFRLGTTKG